MPAGVKRWADIKAKKLTPERRAELDREVRIEALQMTLRELRALAGKTQDEVARAAEMTQGEISRLERREDLLLSSLRTYVEALGGHLGVVAVLGNKRVTVEGI
jgi:DNA-binding XRE family transcriptional regulator